jgi:hypothetical protein
MAWTEIFSRREKDDPERHKKPESQGWACTCGCNKVVRRVSHTEGPPNGLCDGGHVVCTPPTTLYMEGYERIAWNK